MSPAIKTWGALMLGCTLFGLALKTRHGPWWHFAPAGLAWAYGLYAAISDAAFGRGWRSALGVLGVILLAALLVVDLIVVAGEAQASENRCD